jgi:hypothetical protein
MKIVPVGMPGQTNFDSYFGNPGMLRGLRENVIMGRLSVESENSRIPSAAPSPLFDKMLPAVLAEARLSRPRSNLITVVREAIQTIENHADLRANKNANSRLDALLKKLVSAQDRVHNEAQKSALTALIDFLSADMVDLLETGRLDSKNWDLLRKQLEDAWPDLTKTQSSGSLTTRWRK